MNTSSLVFQAAGSMSPCHDVPYNSVGTSDAPPSWYRKTKIFKSLYK